MQSEFIVYIDESGDHGLDNINAQYPIFVLSACIFEKEKYRSQLVQSFLNIKFKYWNHDMVILHSREIRKSQGHFSILQNQAIRNEFLQDINAAVSTSEFCIVSCIINKTRLRQQYAYPDNPYEMTLTFCLERSYGYFKDLGKEKHKTTFIVERRGKKEDESLELCFRRVVQGQNLWNCDFPFEIVFADKKANSSGLQLADLVSYPIGRNCLNPQQTNQAYSVVEPKFRRSRWGKIDGWGRKIFR